MEIPPHLISTHVVSHEQTTSVCHTCRSCSHVNTYLNPEGSAVCSEGRIKVQQNMMGAEKTLLSREHTHSLSFGSDCSKGLLPLLHRCQLCALYQPAWVLFQLHPSRMAHRKKKKKKKSSQQPLPSYNQFEGGSSLSLNPYAHSKLCMSSKLTYHTVINS